MTDIATVLKELAAHVPYPVLLRAFHTWWDTERWARYEYYRQDVALPEFSTVPISDIKRSDTVFILGSGASLNLLTQKQWDAIACHDSFGFNFSHLLPHRPTLYAYEYMGVTGAGFEKWRTHGDRADYRYVPKLFVHVHPRSLQTFVGALPEPMRDNMYTMFAHYTFARSAEEFVVAVQYLQQRGLWTERGEIDEIFKYRGTLTMMVSLALRMGYENIVLCGVDLNNWDYFFDDPRAYPAMTGYLPGRTKHTVHGTQVKHANIVSMTDIILTMSRLLARPRGVNLYIQHAGSALYPGLPLVPQHFFSVNHA